MKIDINKNGEIRMFFGPEDSFDEAALESLSKAPVELIIFNKQVSIIDKTYPKGAVLQRKQRETNVVTEVLEDKKSDDHE